MTKPIDNNHWSTPIGAPLAAPFPFTFRNVEVLTLSYKTSQEAAQKFLPSPLQLRSDWVLIHIYNMNDVDYLGRYQECNVMLDAELPGKAVGGYSPFLFLNSDGGIAQGREVHGQPKKWGNPKVDFRGDLIVGTMERNDIEVITGTMAYKQNRGTIQDFKEKTFDFSINLNYKVINHINGQPAIRQITSRNLEDVEISECWIDPCSVTLRANMQAPIYKLPVIEEGSACFWKGAFTLVEGEIVHDYLN